MNVTGCALVQEGVLQNLLHAALRAHPHPVVWVDAVGNVVFINEHAEQLFGRVKVGGHISECATAYEILDAKGYAMPPLEIPLARASLRGEHVVDEPCKIRRPDGRVVDVLATATPMRDDSGAQVGAMLLMRDVTSEQLYERKLKSAERRFNALVQATGQLVWTTNAIGHICEDSPSWRAYTGQTLTQFLGDGWLYVVHPEDRDQIEVAWRSAVTRRAPYQVEYRIRRYDGQYRWAIARGTPVVDERGVIQEWVGCTWDIHDQRSR